MKMKKLLALLLALIMVVSTAACAGGGDKEPVADQGNDGDGAVTEVVFPLAEQKEFTIIMANDADWDAQMEANPLWQELQTKTNVKINIKRIPRTEAMTSLNNLLLAKDQWDGMFTAFMTDGEYSTLAAADYFMDVEHIITNEKICPNFVNRSMVGREEQVIGALRTPNGGIYGLAGGNASSFAYLESPILLNKAWVEAAGKKIEDIKTIEDIEFLLAYWSKNDMNGNGLDDEIPYLLYENNSQRHMEAFLGLYGVPTKDGTYEIYVTVVDGEVQFVPLMDEWKTAVTKLADWYAKGYIWEDAFAGSDVNTYFWDTILASPIPIVGMMTSQSASNDNLNAEYVAIAPVKVDGYETRWYIHPGLKNTKAQIAVSKDCQDPEILLAWFDQFLSLDTTIRDQYGEEGEGWEYTDGGKILVKSLTSEEQNELNEKTPSLKWITQAGVTLPTCYTADDYANKLARAANQDTEDAIYEMYEPYLTTESWPRPYFSTEQTEEIGKVRTDIMNLITLKRAQWITGQANIEAEYDQFVQDLEQIGVDQLTAVMQEAYDNYIGK